MKYIILPMAVIIGIFLFGLFYNSSSANYQRIFNGTSQYSEESINGTFTENGDIKSLSTSGNAYEFSISETQGILAIVIAVSVIASLIGIRVLSSGLSETTIKILYNTIFFYGVWGIFSAFTLEWLLIIPIGGWIIYFLLTSILSFGIVKQINGNN